MSEALCKLINEILAGDSLTLAQAARKLVPHRGNAVAPSTLYRWHDFGVRLREGGRVYLEMARIGGKMVTSSAALVRFIAAQNPEVTAKPAPQRRTAAQRANAAATELEELGI